ncbi:GerAB/ArcD/ProY family transporter [Neobacillus ginsengisoli]|uniref:Spore germination protein (Amino acid permease) n=1 Tax=Neobacillus ginsengisoli TaxID=904295 RepID=A0ABT9Y0K8_9BACI|nr:endospore germination permease [Neobacillus ginsengisoli]MDQ0201367.1 spore germination protein (amino acid permease) [Neobacillus ginsengisoli]
MESKEESISSFQMFFFIVLTSIGDGILTFPNMVYKDARQASWISIFITGLLAGLLVLTYVYLNKQFPKQTIYEICMVVFGKWVGRIIIVGYILYFFLICININQMYLVTINNWILTSTPKWVILLLMLMLGIYLGKENLRIIVRFFQLSFWIIILLMLMNLGAIPYLHWNYLLPFNGIPFVNILKGSNSSISSFLGFDSILIILPFVTGNLKSKLTSSFFSILFITVTYLYIILTCILFFSSKEMILIPQPILYLYKSLTIFGVIERLDLIVVALWIVMIMTSYISYLYLSNIGICTLFHLKKRTIPTIVMAILVYILVLFLPYSRESILMQFKMITFFSYIFSAGIPVLVIIASFLFHRNDKKEGNTR